jgi:hypothetical protein
MVQLAFYERIEALNSEQHQQLRYQRSDPPHAFARDTGTVPLAGVEIPDACRDYPIVFAGPKESLGPVAILGSGQRNVFVARYGHWETGLYVPAFVRRYPFVLAQQEGGEDLTVCIDAAYPGLSTEAGEPLFDADGEKTPFLQRTVQFLAEYNAEVERTKAFTARLQELGLLTRRDMQITGAGGTARLRGLAVPDEEAVDALTADQRSQLDADGHLMWLHALLISQRNYEKIAVRMEAV